MTRFVSHLFRFGIHHGMNNSFASLSLRQEDFFSAKVQHSYVRHSSTLSDDKPRARINANRNIDFVSSAVHIVCARVEDLSTLALRVRGTNSRVNFMQRDMREVDATRCDATTARLIAVQPPATYNCRVSSSRKRLAFLSLRGLKMTDSRNEAGRDRGKALYDERVSRLY